LLFVVLLFRRRLDFFCYRLLALSMSVSLNLQKEMLQRTGLLNRNKPYGVLRINP